MRVIGAEGVQQCCGEEGCETAQNILSAGCGFDSMTGIGSLG